MSPPRISVLVPAFNEEAHLPQTLGSIHECFAALEELAYEIVVCDNNSTDGTSVVAQRLGARVVFEPHNQIARARNAAAERALGEWLIFIDADTSLNPELLRATLRTLRGGDVVGGGTLIRFDRPPKGWGNRALLAFWNFVSTRFGLAAGSYLYCLRQAWEETGGFDETLYAAEELDFSKRLKKWGRAKGLRFRILTAPIVTSARKMEWYGRRQMLGHALRMLRRGGHRRRENCAIWYERPTAEELSRTARH